MEQSAPMDHAGAAKLAESAHRLADVFELTGDSRALWAALRWREVEALAWLMHDAGRAPAALRALRAWEAASDPAAVHAAGDALDLALHVMSKA